MGFEHNHFYSTWLVVLPIRSATGYTRPPSHPATTSNPHSHTTSPDTGSAESSATESSRARFSDT
nr:hypothetical protein Itr_chr15CG16710 [Ipomoea trifida]